jgi:hypothetical protein
VGTFALTANTSGLYNTALGRSALQSNSTDYQNTAVGRHALSALRQAVEAHAAALEELRAELRDMRRWVAARQPCSQGFDSEHGGISVAEIETHAP